jgi:transposase-like protein
MVAEDKKGRPIVKGEHVHHMDEDPTNNAPNNLKLMSMREHRSYHTKKMIERLQKPLTAGQVEQALGEGNSVKAAAKLLGVNGQTLRNRFPDLVEPKLRKHPIKIGPDVEKEILRYAADSTMSLKATAALLGVGYVSINRVCKRHGVKWVPVFCPHKQMGAKTQYRGQKTLRQSIIDGLIPAPGVDLKGRKLPKKLWQLWKELNEKRDAAPQAS